MEPKYNNSVHVSNVIIAITIGKVYFPPFLTIYSAQVNFYQDGHLIPANDTQSSSYIFSTNLNAFMVSKWNSSALVQIFPSKTPGEDLKEKESSLFYDDGALALFHLSIFNNSNALNGSIALQMFTNIKPPRSPFVPIDTLISVLENGQVGDQSLNPGFFEQEIRSEELPIVTFPWFQFDSREISPNFNPLADANVTIMTASSSASSIGTWYYVNGSQVFNRNSTPLEIPSSLLYSPTESKVFSLRYRPPKDIYSVSKLDIIERLAFVCRILQEGPSVGDSATVSILVQRVYRPPRPYSPLQRISSVSRAFSAVQLLGQAIELDTHIVGVYLPQLPHSGALWFKELNGSLTPVKFNNTNPTVSTVHQSISSFHQYAPLNFGTNDSLLYMYSGEEVRDAKSGNNDDGVVGLDYFTFRLVDNRGLFSVSANVSIQVQTALIIRPITYDVVEGRNNTLYIAVEDLALQPRPLRLQLQINTPGFGHLFAVPSLINDTSGLQVVDRGEEVYWYSEIVFPPYRAQGIPLMLQSIAGSGFSVPNTTMSGELIPSALNASLSMRLQYMINGSSNNGDLIAANATSVLTHLPIRIRNVNDATQITYQPFTANNNNKKMQQLLTINAYSKNENLQPNITSLTFADFGHWIVNDPDRGINPIRIQINASYGGFVTLSSQARRSVDFNSYAYCSTVCRGDGLQDQFMVFVVSTSSALQMALQGLSYHHVLPNRIAFMTITVFDGEVGTVHVALIGKRVCGGNLLQVMINA